MCQVPRGSDQTAGRLAWPGGEEEGRGGEGLRAGPGEGFSDWLRGMVPGSGSLPLLGPWSASSLLVYSLPLTVLTSWLQVLS